MDGDGVVVWMVRRMVDELKRRATEKVSRAILNRQEQ